MNTYSHLIIQPIRGFLNENIIPLIVLVCTIINFNYTLGILLVDQPCLGKDIIPLGLSKLLRFLKASLC